MISVEIKSKIYSGRHTPEIDDSGKSLRVAAFVCGDDEVHNIVGVDSHGNTLMKTARRVVGYSGKFGGLVNGQELTRVIVIDAGTATMTYKPTNPQ